MDADDLIPIATAQQALPPLTNDLQASGTTWSPST